MHEWIVHSISPIWGMWSHPCMVYDGGGPMGLHHGLGYALWKWYHKQLNVGDVAMMIS
jgi:hypothetical protein